MKQLYNSLGKITSLPESTIVFGGHDYLESNLLFSQSIKPRSDILSKRLSSYNSDPQKALFMSLKNEISSNIFLNCESLEQFTELRIKKDFF